MSPREYLDKVVKGMFDRLLSEPSATDLLAATSILVFHTCDYIAESQGVRPDDIINRIKSQNIDFELIHAAANANKHHTITRSPKDYKGLSNPQKPREVSVITYDGKALTYDGDPLTFVTQQEHYISKDGRKVKVIELIKEIIDILEKEV